MFLHFLHNLDIVQKVISEFFNNADRDLVQNNFDLHCEFFEFISEMKCLDLENFMIDFLKENFPLLIFYFLSLVKRVNSQIKALYRQRF